MRLADALRIQARANRLAKRRLHEAMAALSEADFCAPRVSLVPSPAATLSQVLTVDLYCVGARHAEADLRQRHAAFIARSRLAEWTECLRARDERLVALCDGLEDVACDAMVDVDRGSQVQRDRAGHVLAHFFMRQTLHRGQSHAMPACTRVAPPRPCEFLMPGDATLRATGTAALGRTKAHAFGT